MAAWLFVYFYCMIIFKHRGTGQHRFQVLECSQVRVGQLSGVAVWRDQQASFLQLLGHPGLVLWMVCQAHPAPALTSAPRTMHVALHCTIATCVPLGEGRLQN